MITYSAKELQEDLTKEFGLVSKCYPLGQDVVFFGTEIECYRLAHEMRTTESKIAYSEELCTWYISFPYWFSVEVSQQIKS